MYQTTFEALRLPDGSIDYDTYRRRAVQARREARNDVMRAVAGALNAGWRRFLAQRRYGRATGASSQSSLMAAKIQ